MNAVSIKVPNKSTPVLIELGGESVWASVGGWGEAADKLHKKYGGVPKVTNYEHKAEPEVVVAPAPEPVIPDWALPGAVVALMVDAKSYTGTISKVGKYQALVDLENNQGQAKAEYHELKLVTKAPKATKENSSFGGKLIVDDDAKSRIEATHEKLGKAGVKVNAKEQFYATGTRLADIGYATQAQREKEYKTMAVIGDVAAELTRVIKEEKRVDIEVAAGDLGKSLVIGKNRIQTKAGFALTEQAIRGLLARIESPALSYVLGMRDRLASCTDEQKKLQDFEKIAEVLVYECLRNPDVKLKARSREGVGDIFAFTSPTYGVADAPSVLPHIVKGMPKDARGEFNYDPGTTAWEIRANVWTPTPLAEQAVGEAFKGFVSCRSKDNGTASLRGGGGIELLRCLNASVYNAASNDVTRRHRSGILYDIEKLISESTKAIDALCEAWGTARRDEIEVPQTEDGKLLTLEEAIPGFWRHLLRDRSSELQGVLPGSSKEHTVGLTKAFFAERRELDTLVKADFANGWTKYIQGQPTAVRRDAESAVASWLVNDGALEYADA